MTRIVLNVPDMTCGHCEGRVKKALGALDGIERVQVDLETKKVEVDYDAAKVKVEQMQATLAEEDYPATIAA